MLNWLPRVGRLNVWLIAGFVGWLNVYLVGSTLVLRALDRPPERSASLR